MEKRNEVREMRKWNGMICLLLLLAALAGCARQSVPGIDSLSPPPASGADQSAFAPADTPADSKTPPPQGPTPAELAQRERMDALRAQVLAQASALAASCAYDRALTLLDDAEDVRNGETDALRAEIQTEKDALVPYTGPIRHIFFHSLIVDSAKAFDGGVSSAGYDLWMTTRDEFTAMLPLLQARGYMLVDYADLIVRGKDGTISPATLMLPPGKMPLLLSVDDVCYYHYMDGDGFASRLALDADGNVVTIVDGQPTRDGDVVPILDDYVRANPGFSYRGAKGILALTGYEGVLGYRITDLQGDELKQAQDQARAVCGRLKETGWRIASHSYTHNNWFQDGSVTLAQLQSDTERWKTRIEPVTGPTNLYVSPFGMQLRPDDPRFRYLVEQGYEVYCPVAVSMKMTWSKDSLIHERFNLDGYSFRNHTALVNELFFPVEQVYDRTRPTALP